MPKSKLDIIDAGHFAWEDKSRDVRIDSYKLVVWKLSPVLSSPQQDTVQPRPSMIDPPLGCVKRQQSALPFVRSLLLQSPRNN